jgi:hypothetical protein
MKARMLGRADTAVRLAEELTRRKILTVGVGKSDVASSVAEGLRQHYDAAAAKPHEDRQRGSLEPNGSPNGWK